MFWVKQPYNFLNSNMIVVSGWAHIARILISKFIEINSTSDIEENRKWLKLNFFVKVYK